MQIKITNWQQEDLGQAELNVDIFDAMPEEFMLHKIVTWQLAKRRHSVAKTKGRSEVSGSNRKIYSQKGTGRARHSSKKVNIFRKGGVVFGPQVRSFEFKVNKKERKLALKMALSHKSQEGKIIVLDKLGMDSIKTADLKQALSKFRLNSVLLIDSKLDDNLKLSASNLKYVDILPTVGLNVLDILKHDNIILSLDGLKSIEERLK